MYNAFRQFCEQLLRIPPNPESPPGDESTTRCFRAAPKFYKYLLFIWSLKSGVALLAGLWLLVVPIVIAANLAKKGTDSGWLLLLIPALVFPVLIAARLFALAILRLDFDKRWYVVTDRSLRVREGIIVVREMTITFANIQNISISQGPIQRALGIADLRVDTAGGGGGDESKRLGPNLHTAWFHGIDNANEIRQLIQERLRHLKDAGLGDPGPSKADPASRSVATPDVLSVLREIHGEAAALRQAVTDRAKIANQP